MTSFHEVSYEPTYSVKLLRRRRLTEKSFEIEFSRPESFDFKPGQRLRFNYKEEERDYSMISTPADAALSFCIREVTGGLLSPVLATAAPGTRFRVSGPHGYFTFKSSKGRTVFVATGTVIAPFVAMTRSGITGFTLLHGVRKPLELYYQTLLREAAGRYVACLSGRGFELSKVAGAFPGRVTDYLADRLDRNVYDFYLCGRGAMIRDATLLIDERFPGSRIFAESFD